MATINLLYQQEYAITDKIKIVIPTVGDVLENEDEYYMLVSTLTAMPYDMMVPLDDAGIDFTKINDYELFLLMFSGIQNMDTRLVFGDLDLRDFRIAANEASNAIVLINSDGVVIDRVIQNQIAVTLRKIHHWEKNHRKPGNEEAKEYLLRRAREKMKRNQKKRSFSQLESYIVALVNTEQFKYDYLGAKALTIYQFNESLYQIVKKIDYDNKMRGVYFGTVKASDLSQEDLNWLTHK